MKLAICVLLSLAALAGADSSYQQYQNIQNYQQNPYYDDQSASSNYYPNSVATAQRRRSLFDSIRDLFFPGNRRQLVADDGTGDLIGTGGIIGIVGTVIVVVVIVACVVGVVAIFADGNKFTSSGRGLDSDEWEVDHSVWMNQLQKDFENSWSTE